MTDVLEAKYIAVGSPTLNNTIVPTVAAFLCYMEGLHLFYVLIRLIKRYMRYLFL